MVRPTHTFREKRIIRLPENCSRRRRELMNDLLQGEWMRLDAFYETCLEIRTKRLFMYLTGSGCARPNVPGW